MAADAGAMVAAGGVEVLLFGRLREIVGASALMVPVTGAGTVGAVWRLVSAMHPRALECTAVRPAVNERFAAWDAAVRAGDRVAFLPPMSGG